MNINTKQGEINLCTGCQICYSVCPKNAIKIQQNSDGFYMPIINNLLCVNCGMCAQYCYKYDKVKEDKNFKPIAVYSAYIKDKRKLEESSSGGVANLIAEQYFNKGYEITGVAYDFDQKIAYHKSAQSLNDLQLFKGSKYMQSYLCSCLKKVISNNKKNIFFGTPCQIFSLDKYLKENKKREDYILIDFFCHGTPSLFLWKNYINNIEKRTGKISEIKFRNKKYGWHFFANCIKGEKRYYIKKNDRFFDIFFSNQILNESCYNCKTRLLNDASDIRLGDFWGSKFDKNTTGVSTLLINTNRGLNLFENIKEFLVVEEQDIDLILPFQSMKETTFNNAQRKIMIDSLKKDDNILITYKKYYRLLPLKSKIKIRLKKILKFIPNKLYLKIKQVNDKNFIKNKI